MEKNSPIAILGFGTEGQDVWKYLTTRGYSNITICDRNTDCIVPETAKKQCGESYLQNLDQFEEVWRSPGIHYLNPKIQCVKNKVTSVTKRFFKECPAPIIGVTGTKGKGTTATLLHKMLISCGKVAHLAGNIGNSPLELLNTIQKTDTVVLELSSFQLQDLTQSPHGAIILMVTKEHLDVHHSEQEYVDAKKPLLQFQKNHDFAVINTMYPSHTEYLSMGFAQKFTINVQNHTKNSGWVQDNQLYTDINGVTEKLCKTTELQLLGEHNWQNALAASIAALQCGVPKNKIIEVLKTFSGLPHRLEKVGEKNGITFINDSFSTTPETTIAAIRAFSTPIFLVLGGSEKHSDYTDLIAEIRKSTHIKGIIFLGNIVAKRLKNELNIEENTIHQYDADSLESMMQLVEKYGTPGDTVLLSPAAASFDLFENYKERGKAFTKLLKN